jgi:hypothetical protein
VIFLSLPASLSEPSSSNAIAFFIIVSTAATLFVHSGGKGVPIGSAADAAQALGFFGVNLFG